LSCISKSQVSRLSEDIDGKVKAFLDRPLEGDWPYLWIDATYLKMRRGGRIVSVDIIMAVGSIATVARVSVRADRHLGSQADLDQTPALAHSPLPARVKLLVSHAHKGVEAAVTKVPCATWQRRKVYFMRNVLAHAGKSGRQVASAFIATTFAKDTP
jgi:putative transposase